MMEMGQEGYPPFRYIVVLDWGQEGLQDWVSPGLMIDRGMTLKPYILALTGQDERIYSPNPYFQGAFNKQACIDIMAKPSF
jgi:hypothetical protein